MKTMKMLMGCRLGAFVLSALALTAAAQPDLGKIRPRVEKIAEGEMARVGRQSALTSCFWLATVGRSTFNILTPDSGVVYWVTRYRLPAGTSLSLRGQFLKARQPCVGLRQPHGFREDGVPGLSPVSVRRRCACQSCG